MARRKTIIIGSQIFQRGSDGRRKLVFRAGGTTTITATKLTFSTQPDGGRTAVNFTQQPVVRTVDANNNLDTSKTGNVTIAIKTGTGSLSGTTTVAAVGGIATFTDLKITGAGKHVLEATYTGLTAKRSGMMSIVNAAQSAPTVLQFGANTTDRIDCGSGASIDNLYNAGTLTVMMRLYPDTDGDNQFFISKFGGGNNSWAVSANGSGGNRRIEVNQSRGSVDGIVVTAAGTLVNNTWQDFAYSFDNSVGRVYIKPVGTVFAEASYDGTSAQGSGTGNIDAAANLYIGNLQVANTNTFKGKITVVAIFNKILSAAEMATVRVGFDRLSSAIVNGVGGCKSLHLCNATGTLTDLSGNSNSGTVTGATTTTGETNLFYPTVWGASADAITTTGIDDAYFTNAFAEYSFDTSATSAILSIHRTLEAAYDAQASIGVLVDGVYSTQALVTAVGRQFVTVSLPAGSKRVTFVNGARSRPIGTAEGTFLTSVRFNASATEVIPTTPTQMYVITADSIPNDFLAAPVHQTGSINLFRAYLKTLSGSRQLVVDGYGGGQVFEFASDGTKRLATLNRLKSYGVTNLFWGLEGANDYQSAVWAVATFQTALGQMFTDINTEFPTMPIVMPTMVTRPSGEGANGNGETAAQFRTAQLAAASGKLNMTTWNGPTDWWDGTSSDDGSHPNAAKTSTTVFANMKTMNGY